MSRTGRNAFRASLFESSPTLMSIAAIQRDIESKFEADFVPEADQIDFIQKTFKSSIYQGLMRRFRRHKSMVTVGEPCK